MSKVIMYHYVRNYSSKLPYFNFLHKKSFYKQLKFLKRKFNFFVLNDNLHKLRYSKKILLTFDDGLKEHLNIAIRSLIDTSQIISILIQIIV